jgi:hypothetical protein
MHNNAPTPRVWFNPNSLEELTSNATWTRGRLLYSGQKVLDLKISPADGYWLLEGQVQGSERWPYTLAIELTLTEAGEIDTWDADCSCPVGYNCKHGVALTMKAAYQGLRILGSEAALHAVRPTSRMPPTPEALEAARLATQARLEEAKRLEAEAQLLQWFYEMDSASGSTTPHAVSAHNPSRLEQYLYLLKGVGPGNRPQQLHLEAMVSYRKASGEWAKPKAIRTPPHAGQAAYDMASSTDREILQLLLAMPDPSRSYYSAYSGSPAATPRGAVGVITLQQAASTGRLCACNADGSPGTALQWGPPKTLDWSWHEVTPAHGGAPGWALRAKLHHADTSDTPAAHARSSTRADHAPAKLFLNTPPLYLDSANGLCGAVHAPGISDDQLAVLLKAPVLQPSALKKHQLDLMQRLGDLPAPPVLESLTKLDGITPSARLHLSPNPADMAPYRGLIQAQLQFDYQGYCGWWAGQGNSVLVEGPQGRVLLHRDAETELDAITRLMNMGLMSAEGGIFGIPGDTPQHTWLHWADNNYSVLREAGFEVTLHDALKGWITHADALQVQLQPQGQPGGGGDDGTEGSTSPWFDLSLGMEINGQRHNILPLLPELIAAAANSPINTDTGLPEIPPYVYLPNPQASSSTGPGGFIRLPTDTLKPWMAALLELVGDRTTTSAATA